MSNTKTTVTIPIFGLLGILFVGLKLTNHIDWSWFWVTLPLWGGLGLVLGLFALVLVFAVFIKTAEHIRRAFRRRKLDKKRQQRGF
jgi:hypothetical protein